ncbi:hypothetical protein [Kangiella shandongensis]|uniref:hypothetical protein n=1 Tax=Kangiella shandongensis TaxID=2763258 RepID=UPI001CC0426F|nr:hypothetical protein [Kangiella shandongensis]
MRILIIIFASIILSACVEIKAPERLVSDTYRTGKEIYHDIADSDEEQHFVHEIVVAEGAELDSEKRRCVDELVATTRAKYNLEGYKVAKMVHTEGSTETVYCEIKAAVL